MKRLDTKNDSQWFAKVWDYRIDMIEQQNPHLPTEPWNYRCDCGREVGILQARISRPFLPVNTQPVTGGDKPDQEYNLIRPRYDNSLIKSPIDQLLQVPHKAPGGRT